MDDKLAQVGCPFCEIFRTSRPLAENGTFFAIYDKYPASRGHVLFIPKRHIESFFELKQDEWATLLELMVAVRDLVQQHFRPDGFNIGVNDGVAAGQEIPHLHIHLIPRYTGDVEHPAGGVRKIIPNLVTWEPESE